MSWSAADDAHVAVVVHAPLDDGTARRWPLGAAVAEQVLPEILPVRERARAAVHRSREDADRDRAAVHALTHEG